MTTTEFIGANGGCRRNKDAARLRSLLSSEPELTRYAKFDDGTRVIDGMSRFLLTHLDDESAALDLCRVYLDFGADPNARFFAQADCGPLKYAAERSVGLVKLFHSRGARINHDLFGRPACWPLIGAVCANKLDIVRYLIDNGAVVNFVNIHRMSPLDYARNFPEIDAYLRSLGAKPGTELPHDHLPPIEATM